MVCTIIFDVLAAAALLLNIFTLRRIRRLCNCEEASKNADMKFHLRILAGTCIILGVLAIGIPIIKFVMG